MRPKDSSNDFPRKNIPEKKTGFYIPSLLPATPSRAALLAPLCYTLPINRFERPLCFNEDTN